MENEQRELVRKQKERILFKTQEQQHVENILRSQKQELERR